MILFDLVSMICSDTLFCVSLLLFSSIRLVTQLLFINFTIQQEEDMNNLQKRISQLEGDLDEAQTHLDEATQKLENTEKQLANVSAHAPRSHKHSHIHTMLHVNTRRRYKDKECSCGLRPNTGLCS